MIISKSDLKSLKSLLTVKAVLFLRQVTVWKPSLVFTPKQVGYIKVLLNKIQFMLCLFEGVLKCAVTQLANIMTPKIRFGTFTP